MAMLPLLAWAQLEPLNIEDRAALHVRRVFSPLTALGSAAGAGIGQWRGEPRAWGGGMAGYGRRYASSHGYAATQNLFHFGLGAALGEEPRYERSRREGFGGRLADAIAGAVTVPSAGGGRSLRYAFAGSHLGAAMLANAWHPDGHNGVGNGLTRAGINAGLAVLRTVTQEFWPELTARLPRRLRPAPQR